MVRNSFHPQSHRSLGESGEKFFQPGASAAMIISQLWAGNNGGINVPGCKQQQPDLVVGFCLS